MRDANAWGRYTEGEVICMKFETTVCLLTATIFFMMATFLILTGNIQHAMGWISATVWALIATAFSTRDKKIHY